MNTQSGFTIFGLVITLTISGILTLLAGGILNIGVKSYQQYISRSLMLREAQNTMLLLHNKIPMSIPGEIKTARSNHFWFTTSDDQEIDVEYDNKQGVLQYRTIGKHDWRTLLNNIKKNSFTFTYLKVDGIKSHSVDDIRQVLINFNLRIENEEINYESRFFIRN